MGNRSSYIGENPYNNAAENSVGTYFLAFCVCIVLFLIGQSLYNNYFSDAAKAKNKSNLPSGSNKLDDCKKGLNIFTGSDNKKYICPPMYSFGNQNSYGYVDAFKFADTKADKCWIVDSNKKNCGWDSCDPGLYKAPNGKKIALNQVNAGTKELETVGNYINAGSFLQIPNGSAYYINKPMEYSDTEYCPS